MLIRKKKFTNGQQKFFFFKYWFEVKIGPLPEMPFKQVKSIKM